MEEQHIKGIPNGTWSFETWLDGQYFNWIDTETGRIEGYHNETASCGCCSYPCNFQCTWNDLDEDQQRMIIEEFAEGNYK